MIARVATAYLLIFAATSLGAEPISYNREVLPILAEHCFACHGFDKAARQADLRLDKREDALRVLQHSGKDSELLRRICSTEPQEVMPPPKTGKPLTHREIQVLKSWIEQGFAYETHWAWQSPKKVAANSTGAPTYIDAFVLATIREQTNLEGLSPLADRTTLLRRATLDLTGLPPTFDEVLQFRNDERPDAYERLVDRLLASPRYGERWARWWLDLAHYADSDGYLQDFLRPHAYRYRDWVVGALNADKPFDDFTVEQLAGDLLADEVTGGQREASTPAFNEELTKRARELRIATGFLRNTLSNREGGADLEEYRVRQVIDRTSTVATTWLGLTLGCAECHDHKYDPITQKEFAKFYAFFNNVDEVNIDAVDLSPADHATLDQFYEWRTARLSTVRGELDDLLSAWEEKLLWTEQHPGADHRWDRHLEILGLIWGQGEGEGQLEGLNIIKTPREQRTRDEQSRLEEYFMVRGSSIDPAKFKSLGLEAVGSDIEKRRATLPKPSRAQTVTAARRPRQTYVHTRGDFRRPGEVVTSDIPQILRSASSGQVSNRLQLARWLVASDGPLTARVTVNRLWQELFGRGLVGTSENFGIRGNRPSHAQLLDNLAVDFVEHGWSIKQVVRMLMLSDVYQQSSNSALDGTVDPQNIYLARQSRLRLSAEAVRDVVLASSQLMDYRMGGPSTRPPQPESVAMEGFDNKWPVDVGGNRYRRGLYTFIQRTSPFAQSIIFDLPDTSRSCTRRERSNTPSQALTLLNDPVLFHASVHAAHRMLIETSSEEDTRDPLRLTRLFNQVVGRQPTAREHEHLDGHLREQRAHFRAAADDARQLLQAVEMNLSEVTDVAELAAWAMTCSVLLNLDETIMRN